jgi:GNAT superfamily N-acetyltransferase
MSERSLEISRARPGDGSVVGRLVHALICELAPEGRERPSLEEFERVATRLLAGDFGSWGVLARDFSQAPIGVLTLNECAATYARGRFGEIAELYVVPEKRSSSVGEVLLRAAVGFARERGGHHLEVGAPAVPRFQWTVRFYLKNGSWKSVRD